MVLPEAVVSLWIMWVLGTEIGDIMKALFPLTNMFNL